MPSKKSHYDVTFKAPNFEEAMAIRQDALDKHGDIIIGSGADEGQKGKFWYNFHVEGARNKNRLRNYLGEHPDTLLVTVRRHRK